MKTRFAWILFLVLAATGWAASPSTTAVNVAWSDFTSDWILLTNRTTYVTPLSSPRGDGSGRIVAGDRRAFTNSSTANLTVMLTPGSYRLEGNGPQKVTSVLITVPESPAGSYDAADLITTATNLTDGSVAYSSTISDTRFVRADTNHVLTGYHTNILWSNLVSGSGITFSAVDGHKMRITGGGTNDTVGTNITIQSITNTGLYDFLTYENVGRHDAVVSTIFGIHATNFVAQQLTLLHTKSNRVAGTMWMMDDGRYVFTDEDSVACTVDFMPGWNELIDGVKNATCVLRWNAIEPMQIMDNTLSEYWPVYIGDIYGRSNLYVIRDAWLTNSLQAGIGSGAPVFSISNGWMWFRGVPFAATNPAVGDVLTYTNGAWSNVTRWASAGGSITLADVTNVATNVEFHLQFTNGLYVGSGSNNAFNIIGTYSNKWLTFNDSLAEGDPFHFAPSFVLAGADIPMWSPVMRFASSGGGDPYPVTLLDNTLSAWWPLAAGNIYSFSNLYVAGDIRATNDVYAVKYHGDGSALTGTNVIYIDAGAMRTNSAVGPSAGTFSPGNQVVYDTWDFDSSTLETNNFKFVLGEDYDDGAVKVDVLWTQTLTTETTNQVVWGIRAAAISYNNDLLPSFGSEVTVTNAVVNSNYLHVATLPSDLTIGGTPADGDLLAFQIRRIASDPADTLNAGDAKLLAVVIKYRKD